MYLSGVLMAVQAAHASNSRDTLREAVEIQSTALAPGLCHKQQVTLYIVVQITPSFKAGLTK